MMNNQEIESGYFRFGKDHEMNKQEIEKAIELLKTVKHTEIKYQSALDLAITALTQQLTNGWISVNEGLPEINKDVQVTFREFREWNKKYRHGICKAIYIAKHSIKSEDMGWTECETVEEYDEVEDTCYIKDGWYEVIENWNEYTHAYINCEVTAWQPLPSAWEGENNG